MDIRGQVANVRANREKALFSHIFTRLANGAIRPLRIPAKGLRASGNPVATAT